MIAAAVLILLNGTVVASVPPARLVFGHVVAPLAPALTRWSDRVRVDGNTIAIERAGRTCVLHAGVDTMACGDAVLPLAVAPFGRAGVAFVPLADVARALGGTATYDARTRTLSIAFAALASLATPAPFDPAAPQVTPSARPAAVPAPTPARPVIPGSPLPRRTAIPAVPSRDGTP